MQLCSITAPAASCSAQRNASADILGLRSLHSCCQRFMGTGEEPDVHPAVILLNAVCHGHNGLHQVCKHNVYRNIFQVCASAITEAALKKLKVAARHLHGTHLQTAAFSVLPILGLLRCDLLGSSLHCVGIHGSLTANVRLGVTKR